MTRWSALIILLTIQSSELTLATTDSDPDLDPHAISQLLLQHGHDHRTPVIFPAVPSKPSPRVHHNRLPIRTSSLPHKSFHHTQGGHPPHPRPRLRLEPTPLPAHHHSPTTPDGENLLRIQRIRSGSEPTLQHKQPAFLKSLPPTPRHEPAAAVPHHSAPPPPQRPPPFTTFRSSTPAPSVRPLPNIPSLFFSPIDEAHNHLEAEQQFPAQTPIRVPAPHSPPQHVVPVAPTPGPLGGEPHRHAVPVVHHDTPPSHSVHGGRSDYLSTPRRVHDHNNGPHDAYGPKSKYAFGYSVKDNSPGGDDFSHSESRDGHTTEGEYRVALPDGRVQIVSYYANEDGYHANVRYENGEKPPVLHRPPPKHHHQEQPHVHHPAPQHHPAPSPFPKRLHHRPTPTIAPVHQHHPRPTTVRPVPVSSTFAPHVPAHHSSSTPAPPGPHFGGAGRRRPTSVIPAPHHEPQRAHFAPHVTTPSPIHHHVSPKARQNVAKLFSVPAPDLHHPSVLFEPRAGPKPFHQNRFFVEQGPFAHVSSLSSRPPHPPHHAGSLNFQ